MKTYAVPVNWEMTGTVVVEANNREEAEEKAIRQFSLSSNQPTDSRVIEETCIVDWGFHDLDENEFIISESEDAYE